MLEIDPQDNRVIVGSKNELEQSEFNITEVNWVNTALRARSLTGTPFSFRAIAQLRHRHGGVPVTVTVEKDGAVRSQFTESWSTVSPGQAAVFYDLDNQELLGGGRILPHQRFPKETPYQADGVAGVAS